MTPDSEGLHEIANTENRDRRADIVFIHGLCGASHSTWRHGKEGNQGHFFWPEAFGKDLPHCGIWTVGYPAGLTELGEPGMIIEDRANNISFKLANNGLGDRPLFLVTHSMGGLVVKSLIVRSRTLPGKDRRRIVSMVGGIVFCGVPHRGSEFADAAVVLGKFFGGSQPHVREMRRNAGPLNTLHNEFIEWHSKNPVPLDSYAENCHLFRKRTLLRPLFLRLNLVVPLGSADPNIVGHTVHDVDEDHLSLVKPPTRQHDVYAGVLRFILKALMDAPPPPDSTTRQTRSGMGEPSVVSPPAPSVIPAPPEPYLAHPYPMQANFTGRVAERKELTNWFNDTGDPMFVYEAIGGMGKSAVTWYWLHEDVLKAKLATNGVIWWSFYEKESRFETFLEKALTYLTQGEQKVEAVPSTRDRMEWLRQLLCKKRYLVILDGAERVLRGYAGLGSPYQGDEVPEDKKDEYRACVDPNTGTFLQWLTSADVDSKILITSRLFPKELDGLSGCRHKLLARMDKDDAVAFFQRQKIKGTRAEIETACERYGYHPLSLRLLSGMIVADPQYNRDVKTWTKHDPLPKVTPKEHNILELAYESLDNEKRKLISELAAFRNPIAYDSMVVFRRDFSNQQQFDSALIALVDRGLLLRDQATNRHDLHPIIRRYCYDRLGDKKSVHSQLRDYFAAVPQPDKVTCLEDLAPVIELYHHTVRAGQYDEAFQLMHDRLGNPIYYQFGAYQTYADLLRALFPNGEDHLPRLKEESAQGWTLNALANSYSLSGQPRRAVPLFEQQNGSQEKLGNKSNLAIGLGNVADDQLKIGALRAAEANLRRSIMLCQEIKDKRWESVGHAELGRLLTYRGDWAKSNKELSAGLSGFEKERSVQDQGYTWAYRALRELLWLRSASQSAIRNSQSVIGPARRALELADEWQKQVGRPNARDYIRAHWLLGAAPDEARRLAEEALVITERSGYVLQGADARLELAKLALARGDKAIALEHAKEARRLATCDGPPDYTYKAAYDEAGALLDELES